MDIARVDFVHEYEANENVTSLMNGSPGPETLKHCKDIILKATKHLLVSKEEFLCTPPPLLPNTLTLLPTALGRLPVRPVYHENSRVIRVWVRVADSINSKPGQFHQLLLFLLPQAVSVNWLVIEEEETWGFTSTETIGHCKNESLKKEVKTKNKQKKKGGGG